MPITKENVRKLARIVKIDDIVEHKNADRLEIAIIGGWQCVIGKGEFAKGQNVIYVEPDAAVPIASPLFGFLNSRKTDLRTAEDETVYCKIQTIRLRKEISQGLLLPAEGPLAILSVGTDLTEQLGVMKWVKNQDDVIEAIKRKEHWTDKVARVIRGKEVPSAYMNWPQDVPKSDQERIQNLPTMHRVAREKGETFERTQKLNGQSTTFIVDANGVRVTNRNNEIRTKEIKYDLFYSIRLWLASLFVRLYVFFTKGHFSWPTFHTKFVPNDKVASFYLNSDTKEKLLQFWENRGLSYPLVFQGELCGPGINGNYERQPNEYRFFVFNVYQIDENGIYTFPPEVARRMTGTAGLNYVPVLDEAALLPETIREIIKMAEGKSALKSKVNKEGDVWKSNVTGLSFKVISESFALKEAKEDVEETQKEEA